MGLGFYCYCHLPLIDFLPYKIGVNIREEMHASSAAGPEGELQTVLVYRNRIRGGGAGSFALDDTEWQDGYGSGEWGRYEKFWERYRR